MATRKTLAQLIVQRNSKLIGDVLGVCIALTNAQRYAQNLVTCKKADADMYRRSLKAAIEKAQEWSKEL